VVDNVRLNVLDADLHAEHRNRFPVAITSNGKRKRDPSPDTPTHTGGKKVKQAIIDV